MPLILSRTMAVIRGPCRTLGGSRGHPYIKISFNKHAADDQGETDATGKEGKSDKGGHKYEADNSEDSDREEDEVGDWRSCAPKFLFRTGLDQITDIDIRLLWSDISVWQKLGS